MSVIARLRGYAREIVALSDQVGELARDANRVLVAHAADIAALEAGGAGFAFSGIRITHTGDTNWTSTTWAAVHNACAGTISDVFAEGVSRSNSDFTFLAAGRWAIHGQAIVRVSTAGHWSMRLRDTSGGVTKAIGASYMPDGSTFPITGVFETTAGQTLQLQYVTNGADSVPASSAATLDSEALPTFDVSIWRVS